MSAPNRRTLALALLLVAGACAGPEPAPAPRPAPTEPGAARWRTWVLSWPGEVGVPPPPAPSSPEAAAEERERLEMSARISSRSGSDPAVEESIALWDGALEPLSAPWMRMALDLVASRPADLPGASRAYALVAVAAFDATVAAWHHKYAYGRPPPQESGTPFPAGPEPSYPSEHAAVAGAASRVLAHLFPERPAVRFDEAAESAAGSRVAAGTNWRSDVTAGLALGRKVADRVIARATRDGAREPCSKEPPGGPPEFWVPPAGGGMQPCAGSWKPWVLDSGDQLRPGPPARLGSPEFTEQATELIDVRRLLTGEERRAADYWSAADGSPLAPGLWNEVLISYLRRHPTTRPQAERAMVMANVAMADAGVAAWDAKYTYWDPRPDRGVADAGLDPGWRPYLARIPPSPAYVSARSAYAGAITEVLSWLFPAGEGEFRHKARQASDAQVWGGVQWGQGRSIGLDMGADVGRRVIDRARSDGPRPRTERAR